MNGLDNNENGDVPSGYFYNGHIGHYQVMWVSFGTIDNGFIT